MKYMGIDHHKQYFIATVMSEEGKVISKEMVSTDRMAIRDYIKRVNGEGQLKAVIEACYGWSYMYDEIQELVYRGKSSASPKDPCDSRGKD